MTTRRDFLKLSGAAIAALALPSSLFASNAINDYKALVIVYQGGGNDTLNMFIPSGDDENTGYSNYAKARENIKVANTPLTLPTSADALDLTQGNPYAVGNDLEAGYQKGFYTHQDIDLATNPMMPELAHLIDRGKVAIVTNCGNLIEPVTKAELLAKTKAEPPFLFAHNHQTKLFLNGRASTLNSTGWAGRLYDNWQDLNGGNVYGMNIGISNNSHVFYGDRTTPLTISSSGPSSYTQQTREIYDELLQENSNDKFASLYQKLQKHSFTMQDTLVNDWNNNNPTLTSTNAYGGALFSFPSDTELNQGNNVLATTKMLTDFNAVAKLIHIGKNAGLKRQVFFVNDNGYDHHDAQTAKHSEKLRGLSMGLGDFYKALEDMGMTNEVTTFNASEFGRTTGDNGDGTDHAWAGTYFAMGGAVNGGLYGTLADLTLGGPDDISQKGRLIPTISMSQYIGTIVKWFGADDALLTQIVPELNNFTTTDLGFMNQG